MRIIGTKIHTFESRQSGTMGRGPLLMAVARASQTEHISIEDACAHRAKGSEARVLERRQLHLRLRARQKVYAGREQLGCGLVELGRSDSKRAAKAADERVEVNVTGECDR